jgi:hypothetical protein
MADDPTPDPRPRWVKMFLIVTGAVIVLAGVVLILAGHSPGERGPGRHSMAPIPAPGP